MNADLPKRGRPPISGETATGHIQARTSMSRKNAYVRAAHGAGLGLTVWMFKVLDAAAKFKDQHDTAK